MSRIKDTTPLLDSATPMPESVARIVEVFREDLADVEFPGVSLAALERSAEIVRERTAALDVVRNQVSAAEAELAAARCELGDLAERGLAYAKVYATGNATLTKKLAEFGVSEGPKRKRRKSPKNVEPSLNIAGEQERSAPEPVRRVRSAASDEPNVDQIQVANAG